MLASASSAEGAPPPSQVGDDRDTLIRQLLPAPQDSNLVREIIGKYLKGEVKNIDKYLKEEIKFEDLEQFYRVMCRLMQEQHAGSVTDNRVKIALEEHKLAIMKSFQSHLGTKFNFQYLKKTSAEEKIITCPQKGGIVLIILFDIVLGALGGVLGLEAILSSPYFYSHFAVISQLFQHIICGILCGLDCILSYSISRSFIEGAAGVTQPSEQKSIYSLHDQQLKTVETLNNFLFKNLMWWNKRSLDECRLYVRFVSMFDRDLSELKVPEVEESGKQLLLRCFLLGAFTLVAIANSFFLISAFLVKYFPHLVLTSPLGVLILGILIVGQVSVRFLIRNQSIKELIHPTLNERKNIEDKLSEFRENPRQFDIAIESKKKLEHYEQLRIRGLFPETIPAASTASDSSSLLSPAAGVSQSRSASSLFQRDL